MPMTHRVVDDVETLKPLPPVPIRLRLLEMLRSDGAATSLHVLALPMPRSR
ncbi:hypothetical protein [Brachybacterium sp. P6-10-X1]|uniref:hypothetical protein n=1 Tax=Brachybacterium sp. P6-10-X1 TaxID=1903186 RepID=UPI0012FBD935|nr:hypothetical protein [Brachybacterium sp. P6-10-X1]